MLPSGPNNITPLFSEINNLAVSEKSRDWDKKLVSGGKSGLSECYFLFVR
jgi:hypothetical protein